MAGRATASARQQAVAPPPWAPTDVAGLVLWHDYSNTARITHAAGEVSAYDDLSTQNSDAAQATGALKPNNSTDGTTGLNTLQFDGGDCLDVADSAALDLTTGLTIMVACIVTSFAGYGYLVAKDGTASGAAYDMHCDAGGTSLFAQVNTTTARISAPSLAGRHIFEMAYNKVTLRGMEDGVADGSSAQTADITTTAKTFTIGNGLSADPNYGFTGYIGEILVYNSDIGTTDRGIARAYLKAKWATV